MEINFPCASVRSGFSGGEISFAPETVLQRVFFILFNLTKVIENCCCSNLLNPTISSAQRLSMFHFLIMSQCYFSMCGKTGVRACAYSNFIVSDTAQKKQNHYSKHLPSYFLVPSNLNLNSYRYSFIILRP